MPKCPVCDGEWGWPSGHFCDAYDPHTDCIQRQITSLRYLIADLQVVYESDASWETKYGVIFSAVGRLRKQLDYLGLELEWLNLDTTYEEDTQAVMVGILKIDSELAKLERVDDEGGE